LSDRIIYDITPFTHLDYPDNLAAIVWFVGCNMRCMYCYNSDIVFAKEGRYTPDDLLSFLRKRTGLLDGVVLSGGEPTLHDLAPLCRKIRALGFKIKLDTNGLNPTRLRELVEEGLVQYVALDFKANGARFGYITGSSRYERFLESLDFLIGAKCPFEVRTTVHPDLLGKEAVEAMAGELYRRGYRGTYYLQSFVETGRNIADIGPPTHSFKEQRLDTPLPVLWR